MTITLESFDTIKRPCRMCTSSEGYKIDYCEQMHMRGITVYECRNTWMDANKHNAGPSPHLHATCGTCGFEWLVRTAEDRG